MRIGRLVLNAFWESPSTDGRYPRSIGLGQDGDDASRFAAITYGTPALGRFRMSKYAREKLAGKRCLLGIVVACQKTV